MAVLEDYLRAWGQYTLDERPLTEADLLLFNDMTYLPFEAMVSLSPDLVGSDDRVRFEDLFRYFSAHRGHFEKHNPLLINTPRIRNWTLAARSPRYRDLKLTYFVSQYHHNKQISEQFAAYAIDLSAEMNRWLIVFKGTDQSLAGWYENFLLATQGLMPGHHSAREYCNKILKATDLSVIVTGYSKGGSLAVYGGYQCENPSRIDDIYTFDSPGFQSHMIADPKYQQIQSKIKRFVPEDSIVGMILDHGNQPIVIKSHLFSLIQHFLFLWEIDLETGQLRRDIDSDFHIHTVNKIAERWLDEYSPEEVAFFLDLIYSLLTHLGIDDVHQILYHWVQVYRDFKHSLREESPECQEKFYDMIRRLVTIGQEVMRENFEERLEDWHIYKEQLKNSLKDSL